MKQSVQSVAKYVHSKYPKLLDMNEVLKKLAGEALDEAVPNTWSALTPYEVDKLTRKFAELLIDDVMKLAWKESDRYLLMHFDDCSKAMENFHAMLKQRYKDSA